MKIKLFENFENMEKINVWFVVTPHEDNRPSINWFLSKEEARNSINENDAGEPIIGKVETFVGSNVHKEAKES